MVMAGRIRLSFRLRMLFTMLGICWVLAGAFMAFQYQREKRYKADILDTRLQMHNARIFEDMQRGERIESIVNRIGAPVENLRVTLIDSTGHVAFDSGNTPVTSNHNSRPEVAAARKTGKGYAIARLSESDNTNYFYSARRGEHGFVIRSAAPYAHTLSAFLKADLSIMWIMGFMTLLISIIVYGATQRVAMSIKRLNDFAGKAEKGERIFRGYTFPHDELGSIAGHIVRLYVQRDERHREALRLEQDKARLKKQLTNNINHELKTPVASMLVSLDLLADHPELSEAKRREILSRIRHNAMRLSDLLRDVSTITRMDDGKEMIEKKPIDLTALITEVVNEARPRTDIAFHVNVPQLTISGDRNLLESIFRNIIDNAIAYSGATELNVTADPNGRFRIWDNGCGVAAEHLPHLFERFYRIDNGRTRPMGGTGLGLSIVKNAVALHGGSIKAASTNGLMFEFTLDVEGKT